MPRAVVMPVKEIYTRRATNWEWHYKNRSVAKLFAGEDAIRINYALNARLPVPELLVDGSLYDSLTHLRVMAAMAFEFRIQMRTLMCVWYWSESGWMDFVRAFQNLPEVFEPYYMFYEEAEDALRWCPVSTMGHNAGREVRGAIGPVYAENKARARRNSRRGGTEGEVRGNRGGSGRVVPGKVLDVPLNG